MLNTTQTLRGVVLCYIYNVFIYYINLQKNNPINNKSREIATFHGFGTLEGIRTPDLLVRSQTLYPTELPAHMPSYPLENR